MYTHVQIYIYIHVYIYVNIYLNGFDPHISHIAELFYHSCCYLYVPLVICVFVGVCVRERVCAYLYMYICIYVCLYKYTRI